MAKSDEKKPMMPRNLPSKSGMDPDAGVDRAEFFRRLTQGRNKATKYGTGVPPSKPKKGER